MKFLIHNVVDTRIIIFLLSCNKIIFVTIIYNDHCKKEHKYRFITHVYEFSLRKIFFATSRRGMFSSLVFHVVAVTEFTYERNIITFPTELEKREKE